MWLLLACNPSAVVLPPVGHSTDSIDQIGGEETGSCMPVGETVYGVEGQELTTEIRCSGAGTADQLEVAGLPDGARFDQDRRQINWTPSLDQAGYYPLTIVAEGPDGRSSGTVNIWVADAWDDTKNKPVDPAVYQLEYGLPVLHLNRPADTNFDTVVDTTATYRGHTYNIGLQYRGAASSYYPKNSYRLEFPADDEFRDKETGFPKRRSVVLTSTFDDNSYFRQKLCFDLWNELDPSRHRVENQFVVVYINGAYEGLNLMTDHIDGEYWEDQGYSEDGNLYKSVDHSANFYDTYYGSPKWAPYSGYEKKEGTPADGEPGAYDDLVELIDFVVESSDSEFRNQLGQKVALAEFMDWWILVRYTEADDSAGKNAYLYHDPAAGLWHFAPWDFNHSLGQTWQTQRESSKTNEDFSGTNNLFNRMLSDTNLGDTLVQRFQAALAGPYADATMQARIDAYVAAIKPEMDRDWEKWGEQYRSYGGWNWRTDWTTPEEEIDYVRTWVRERSRFMEQQYP